MLKELLKERDLPPLKTRGEMLEGPSAQARILGRIRILGYDLRAEKHYFSRADWLHLINFLEKLDK